MSTTFKVRAVTTPDGYEFLCHACDELGDEALLLRMGADGMREHPDVIFLDGQRSDDAVIIGWDELPLKSMAGCRGSLSTLLGRLDGEGIPWQYAAIETCGDCSTVRTGHGTTTPSIRLDVGIMSVFDHMDGDRTRTSAKPV